MNSLANIGDAFEAYLRRKAESGNKATAGARQLQTLIGIAFRSFTRARTHRPDRSPADLACDPALPEPDLALSLEVCDLVNQAKKNA